jgi:hypothetical protein
MRSTFRSLAVGCTVIVALSSAACEITNLPTPTGQSPVPVVEQFTGTLQPSGDAFFAFSMSQGGDVALTLSSVVGPSVPEDALFPLGLGIPVGTGCTAGVDVALKPGSAPYTVSRGSGVFCVRIADNSRLGAPATFNVLISHPR